MTGFLGIFDRHLRKIARDRIVAEPVTVLHSDMEPRVRASIALQTLKQAIATLEMVAEEAMLNGEQVDALDHAESRLALLRPRVKLRRSMLHLAGVFGRPL